MTYASVVPLVNARALARPFTYTVDDDVPVGAIVRVPFGRGRARGIVIALGVIVYMIRARTLREWPFAEPRPSNA